LGGLAQQKDFEMNCQYCKHSIDEHDSGGCHRKIDGGICDCNHSPNYIAAQQMRAGDLATGCPFCGVSAEDIALLNESLARETPSV